MATLDPRPIIIYVVMSPCVAALDITTSCYAILPCPILLKMLMLTEMLAVLDSPNRHLRLSRPSRDHHYHHRASAAPSVRV